MLISEFLKILNDINIRIVFRGEIAFKILMKDNEDKIKDIDLIISNFNELDEFLSFLRNNFVKADLVTYQCDKRNIPRQRIVLETSCLRNFIVDVLVFDNYFPEAAPFMHYKDNLLIPSQDELLAETIVSMSPTSIGMELYKNTNKALRVLERVNKLQTLVSSNKVFLNIIRILKIQNCFHGRNVSIEDVLSGTHKLWKKITLSQGPNANYDINIHSIILMLSKITVSYNDSEVVEFFKSNDPYGCFSNFSNHPVSIYEAKWPSAEHCYQAQKFVDKELWLLIFATKSPKEAATLGRSNSIKLRKDWEFIKISKMYEIVKQKVIQNSDVYIALMSTEDKDIVEVNPNDNFWGIGSNKKGKNVLGKILQSIREDIK